MFGCSTRLIAPAKNDGDVHDDRDHLDDLCICVSRFLDRSHIGIAHAFLGPRAKLKAQRMAVWEWHRWVRHCDWPRARGRSAPTGNIRRRSLPRRQARSANG